MITPGLQRLSSCRKLAPIAESVGAQEAGVFGCENPRNKGMNDSRQALEPHPEPGPQPVETPTPACLARLLLRVWPPTRFDLSWTSESPLTSLISDLISASDGILVDDSPGMVAQFANAPQALKAAKRIQWSLLEFCKHRPELCLGAAAVIYDPAEFLPGLHGRAAQEPAALLEHAKPAQILVTASASNQLHGAPGVDLRELPYVGRGSSDWRGLQELLWTSSVNLEQIQRALKDAAQKVVLPEDRVLASEPTADLSSTGAYRGAPPTRVRDEPPLLSEPGKHELLSELVEHEPALEGAGSRILWWSLAAAGVLAVLLTVALVPRLRTKPAVLGSPTVVPAAPVAEPAPVKEEPPPAAPPESTPVSPPKMADEQKTPARHSPSDQSARVQAKKAAEYEGLTEKDIPMLLRMAENHAGAGNYEDARREFSIVLHLDPSNAEAKQGMRKLELSERETR